MPINSTRGAASAKAFGFTAGSGPIFANFLLVAGGAGGGHGYRGGGGGGGGMREFNSQLITIF